MGDNFHISENKYFKDDLTDIAVLIYTNASTAVEAVTMGVPVIHVDLKEPMSLDPLFKLDFLKWTVSDQQGLRRTIDYVCNMDEEEYMRSYEKARAYIKDYFYPVEEKYLKEFL